MQYFVYILFSESLNRFYIGTTDDVNKRLHEHNTGHYDNSFTIKGIPWSLFHVIECMNSKQAFELERFIKKMKSAVFIRRLKTDPGLVTSLLQKMGSL